MLRNVDYKNYIDIGNMSVSRVIVGFLATKGFKEKEPILQLRAGTPQVDNVTPEIAQ